MDNNMTAIVSVLMLGIGFLNGMIVTTLLDRNDVEKVYSRVKQVLSDKFELEQEVDSLREELAKERLEKEQLVSKLSALVNQHTRLPPPSGPLERSRACSDTSSDNESSIPTSPDGVQNNKD